MRVYRDDQKFLTFRINALLWGMVGVFVFLAGAFWFVQSVQAEKWRNLSEANALREIIVPAKRGLFVEHAGAHGGTGAAPLARLLYQSRFGSSIASAN
jgi:cell division protein FtsI/penicillin-binding protein 2